MNEQKKLPRDGHVKQIIPIDCHNGICVESTPREVRKILVGNHNHAVIASKSPNTLTPHWVKTVMKEQLELHEQPLYIYKGWCKRCGICIATCPAKALAWGEDGAPAVDPEKCLRCKMCEYRCPELAITILQERKRG